MKGETQIQVIDRWYTMKGASHHRLHNIDSDNKLIPKLKKSFKVIPRYVIEPIGACSRTDYMFNYIEIPTKVSTRLKYCFDSVKPMPSLWKNVININAVNLFKAYSGTIYMEHQNYFNGINSYYFIDESRIARVKKPNRFDEKIGL